MRITEEAMNARREQMIRVAYRLFKECGIDAVSQERIAAETGVSLKTVSRYFNSKAQLVEQTQTILWKEIVNCIIAGNQDARFKAADGLEELEMILWGFATLYQDHSDYVLFYYDYQSYLIRNRIQLTDAQFARILADVRPFFLHALERGQKDGSITADDSPEEQFLLMWAIVRYYVEHLVIYDQLYTGENPWKVRFPKLLKKVLKIVKA